MLSLPLQIINAAANRDREGILRQSRHMKFLTGFESKVNKSSKKEKNMLQTGLRHIFQQGLWCSALKRTKVWNEAPAQPDLSAQIFNFKLWFILFVFCGTLLVSVAQFLLFCISLVICNGVSSDLSETAVGKSCWQILEYIHLHNHFYVSPPFLKINNWGLKLTMWKIVRRLKAKLDYMWHLMHFQPNTAGTHLNCEWAVQVKNEDLTNKHQSSKWSLRIIPEVCTGHPNDLRLSCQDITMQTY